VLVALSATNIAPTKIIPWIAFAPDIRGVCKVVETFETTSNPTKIESRKMVKIAIDVISYPPVCDEIH